MVEIPAISCTNCVFYLFDPVAGEWSCCNPDNPDRERVDDYGIFDCEYSFNVDLEGGIDMAALQEP